jgi:L-iditol 2-dehydrogenase
MNMRCIRVETVGTFQQTTVAIPTFGRNEVLIKVDATGLCRTDLKLIRQGHRDLILPRIPGEEVVGTLVACGSEVIGLNVGQRVYVYPGVFADAALPVNKVPRTSAAACESWDSIATEDSLNTS